MNTEPQRTLRQKLAPFIPYVFYACIIIFFALYLRSIDFRKLTHLQINWWLIVAATICGLAFRYWGVVIWRVILRALGSHELPPYRLMAFIYAKAWMGRYIPGTVPWIASKIYMAGAQGISKSRLTVAALLEGGMQVVANTVIAMLLIGFDSRLHNIPLALKALMVVAAGGLLICLSPPVFNRFLALAYRLLRRGKPHQDLQINSRATVRSFVLFAGGGLVSGFSYFLITKAIAPATSWSSAPYLIGAFNLAGALGMAAPFVPSGIGVRDGAQLVLLAPLMPPELALVVTVFSRLWSAAVDVLFFAVASLIHHLQQRSLPH